MDDKELNEKIRVAVDKHVDGIKVVDNHDEMQAGYLTDIAHYTYRVDEYNMKFLFVWSGYPTDPVRVNFNGEYNGEVHASFYFVEDEPARMIPFMVGPMNFAKNCTGWIHTQFLEILKSAEYAIKDTLEE